ncbi:related to RFX1-major transcriptional repressor of DNA-damage-regulated genes [Sporisorium scitamineum]|uniref:Related to RFX1-major transcriptional repressor of DNA-damage-regulated genes n=1 Tax=Sporisorium scitamineum TaxID=49012 RepID=A0A127ZI84_9BASI|nr:related to RFX1-major transcriptional repressor of DNA-damage-regulated genes [Sporisorium scitamineum]
MSAPYYTGQASASDSPYRPGTADSAWEQSRPSTMGEARPDLFAHTATAAAPSSSSSSHFRPEPLLPSQSPAIGGSQAGAYLGANVVTPRQTAFPRDQMDAGAHLSTPGAIDSFDHGVQAMVPTDTLRAAHFGSSSALVGPQHTFAHATSSAWPGTMQHQHQQQHQQPQSESMTYSRYAYPSQTGSSAWASPAGMSMSQSVIYDSSSSANTSPNRSQTYYDMSSDHFDHAGYASHMGSHTYPVYGASTSKMGASSAYIAAPQPEYQPEEIDSMLNQVSTLYKTANTKKMAEFYRDKWARMWLTCNYTLKPSIQISIPRTILHESYRRACDSFGLEPLQAASFGKVLRSQFPDVAQRRLGGRGKTRFHYCGFGTSNEREAIKVKSLLEDEKAGKLQLSAGLSAGYAAEARNSARSEPQEGESSSSYRTQASSEASPGEGPSSSRAVQYAHSPHTSSESSGMGHSGIATDDRLIASAFATLNSAVLTPPGTSSGITYGSQDAGRHPQVPSQGHGHASQSTSAGGATIPRRHTVSHSYSGLGDLSFLPGLHSSNESGVMHPSSDVSVFGAGTASGISEPAQSASLLNSPASLHGYQYLQDPRHMPTSIPFHRSCQDLPDWPTLPDQHSSNTSVPNTMASSSASTYVSGGGSTSDSGASHESTRKLA